MPCPIFLRLCNTLQTWNADNCPILIASSWHGALPSHFYPLCKTGVICDIPLSIEKSGIDRIKLCLNSRLMNHKAPFKGQPCYHQSSHWKECGCAPVFTDTRVLSRYKEKTAMWDSRSISYKQAGWNVGVRPSAVLLASEMSICMSIWIYTIRWFVACNFCLCFIVLAKCLFRNIYSHHISKNFSWWSTLCLSSWPSYYVFCTAPMRNRIWTRPTNQPSVKFHAVTVKIKFWSFMCKNYSLIMKHAVVEDSELILGT